MRELGWEDELIERQLGHDVGSDVKRAYDKSKRLPDRRRMVQAWADYLDGLRAGSKTPPARSNRSDEVSVRQSWSHQGALATPASNDRYAEFDDNWAFLCLKQRHECRLVYKIATRWRSYT